VIRNIKRYREAAQMEIDALNRLHNEDPTENYPIVRLLESFNVDGHVCLRFPVHGISTYQYLKENNYHSYRLRHIIDIAEQVFRSVFLNTKCFLFFVTLISGGYKGAQIYKFGG